MAEDAATEDEITILVTGFGAFLDIKTNPSWEIVKQLPTALEYKWMNIRIITPKEPLRAAYHDLLQVPRLLEEVKPKAVIHIGLDVDRDYFSVERGTNREGYHEYPDVARRVFNKIENKTTWGKSPARLDSSLDLEDVLRKWKINAGQGSDVRVTDDVGNYVCGFVYYASLEHFWKKGEGALPVVFMHVPPLPGKDDIEKGKKITVALIQAIAESIGE